MTGFALPPSASGEADQELTFSGQCPIDIIFPLRVRAERVRELNLVPSRYETFTGPDGRVVMVVSLLYCDETRINGVASGAAYHHDMLFQIEPPFGTASIIPDHQLDGYWSWFATSDRRLQKRLGRLGMHHGFDPGIELKGTWAETPFGGRLVSLSGRMPWPHSPFRITGIVLDTAVAEGSDMRFWQDVRRGVLRSRLIREFGAEQGSGAYYRLTTPVGSPIAKVLEDQCTAVASNPGRCQVSGPGFVTHIVGEFVHNIEVRRAAEW